MKERRCVIISGGDEEKIGDVRGAFVIGCDRGCLYAERQGIRPDLCVGDFDSYGGPLPEGVPAGTKLQPGRLCDLVPTMLELLGLPQPKEMTGKSLIVKD